MLSSNYLAIQIQITQPIPKSSTPKEEKKLKENKKKQNKTNLI